MEDAARGVDPLRIAADLVAEESLSEGMLGVAIARRDAAVNDRGEDAARIRALVRADGLAGWVSHQRPAIGSRSTADEGSAVWRPASFEADG